MPIFLRSDFSEFIFSEISRNYTEMKRGQIGLIGIAVSIGIIFLIISYSPSDSDSDSVFHITLADPELYSEGVYSEEFLLPKGEFMFRFVPNGDSPKNLEITLSGTSFWVFQNFELKGTPHDTGISEYYTWEYLGNHNFSHDEEELVEIKIDPNQNFLGPVTVEIIQV